jgi:hypothetical protein
VHGPDALIGYTGFVGSTLRRQREFGAFFNSSNFRDMRGHHFGTVVSAGVPAEKWLANKDPDNDRARIGALREELATISADLLVLISTVDVYPGAVRGVDEDFDCSGLSNHAYGTHRLDFEVFVRERFCRSVVVRLPALFGNGLKKNALFDLLNDNGLEGLNLEGRYQWYDMSRLWANISLLLDRGITVANLVTEPLALCEIVNRFFPGKLVGQKAPSAASYDIRTRNCALFGRTDGYIQGQEEVLERMSRFIGSYREEHA